MIKREVEIEAVKNGEVVTEVVTLHFRFTLKAIELFESNNEEKFHPFLEETIGTIKFAEGEEMRTISKSTEFLKKMVPCMYTKIGKNNFIQDNETYKEALENGYVDALFADLEFFMNFITEITTSKIKEPKGGKKKGK